MAPVAEKKKRWATPEDWAAHKETIIRLYQDRELEEVMQIMERDHHFYSTKKIYKTKFKEWDVSKRLNDDDVLTILQLRDERAVYGKQSEFWLSGKRVSEANVLRYLRRKPELLVRYRRGYRPPASSQCRPRVVCTTPVLEPRSLPRAGGILGEAEIIFVDCRDYFRSSFETGSWDRDESGIVVSRSAGSRGTELCEDVVAKVFTAADLLARSSHPDAFKVLDLAFRSASEIVSLNAPRLLCTMLAVLSRLERRGQRDTLNIFRKYLLSRAHSLDKTASKLPVVLQRLARLDVARYDELFPRLFDLLIEQADQLFGCGSDLSLETYWQRYGAFVVRESTAEQVRSIQKENDKIPRDAPPRPWILRQRRLYAWKISQMERDRGRFDAAQEALRTVEHTYKDPADRVDESRHWLFAAVIEERRGDPAAAEKYHRLALQKSMQGKDEDAVQYSLFRLTQLLDKLGRDAEAERVREYGKQRISELVAHVQWDWQEFQRRTAVEDISIPTPESVVED